MSYFIKITQDDFWTALRNGRIIHDRLKPKPYREYRRLDDDESSIVRILDSTVILLMGQPKFEDLKWKSMANRVCETFPALAAKHNLVIDSSHEYWRN